MLLVAPHATAELDTVASFVAGWPENRPEVAEEMNEWHDEGSRHPVRARAQASLCVCAHGAVTNLFRLFLLTCTAAVGSRVCSWREPTKLQVQTRISKKDALSTYLPMFQSLPSIHFKLVETFC